MAGAECRDTGVEFNFPSIAAKTYLLRAPLKYIGVLVADVAELADALDSKSSTRKSVWVRPPPSAPYKLTIYGNVLIWGLIDNVTLDLA